MGSPDNMSKRERQKQRRGAKLEQQRAIEARERRNRLMVFALLGVIFAGLVGYSVYNRQQEGRQQEEVRAAVAARRAELGCTPLQEPADAGQGHLDAATLAEQPPDALYPDRPATSGQHFGSWLKTGVYDQQLDERALVHNLEHGYVTVYYDEGAPEDQVVALKEYSEEQIDGPFKKVIVAPWDGELPNNANFSYTAWSARQMCETFDEDTYQVFLDQWHSGAGVAPEKVITPHLQEGNGTIDPKGEPFLLPPLDTQAAPSDGADDGGGDPASEAPVEDSS